MQSWMRFQRFLKAVGLRVVDARIDEALAAELEQDPAFVAELRRRADAALFGKTEGTPWRDVMTELRAELEERRARRKSA